MKTYGPPAVATSDDRYFMKAVIGGKTWMVKNKSGFTLSATIFRVFSSK